MNVMFLPCYGPSAEQESKAKQEKLAEIRKATAKMVAIKRYVH